MSAIPVPDEATWLSLREANVGGSEIASLFYRWRYTDGTEAVHHLYENPPEGAVVLGCISPFKSGYALWQEKAGRVPPTDLSNVEYVNAGVYLEPALAEWAKSKWDWKLRKVRRYLVHDEVKGWGASLDYEVVGEGMPPVEFKNADGFAFRDGWTVDGDDILMPPLNYVLQLQHQIGATGADHGWIVACVGGNKLMRGRIERHEPTLQRIAEAITAFWQGVEANAEPTWLADYEGVAEAYRYGTPGQTADLTSDDEMPVLCAAYLEAKRLLEEAETNLELAKGRVAAKLGENAKANTAGYRLSWPVIERAEKVIPERIQKALTYRGGLTVTALKD